MVEIDPESILSFENSCLEAVEADGIPLIDLHPLISSDGPDPTAMEALVTQIGEACKEWGFFQVVNHGVPHELRRNVDSFTRKFFAMSKAEKRKTTSSNDEAVLLGYHDSEYTRKVKGWKEGFEYISPEPMILPSVEIINHWPENLHGMKETCMEYGEEMEKLARKLMELIALSLGLSGDRFREFLERPMSTILLNRYPKCPVSDPVIGINAHKDCGVLTVLGVDDVPGLQVKRKTDGQWLSVKYVPHAYIINLGDVIQVWSNDRYESVEHRVMANSEKDRFSIPFFFHASHDTMVEPLPELVNDENPPKYTAYNWGKFFAMRNRTNFVKHAEETEIFHFKKVEDF